MQEEEIEVESVETHHVDEFDVGTRIELMNDKSLRLKVPYMPPPWAKPDNPFESFAYHLSVALGVQVVGLDKEFFSVPKPPEDGVARLKAYLIELRNKAG